MTAPTFDQLEKTRLAALRLLETRARSKAELTERLHRKKLPKHAVTEVVDRLVEVGLVNDGALAEDIVRGENARLPAGEALLRHRLERFRIDEEAAEAAVETHEGQTPAIERATELAKSAAERLPRSLTTEARYRRVLGLLARRGFDEETATTAVEAVLGTFPDTLSP